MKGSRLMQIQKRIIQKELKYENVVVLKYHIEYPRITNESNNIPSMKFKEKQKMNYIKKQLNYINIIKRIITQ